MAWVPSGMGEVIKEQPICFEHWCSQTLDQSKMLARVSLAGGRIVFNVAFIKVEIYEETR